MYAVPEACREFNCTDNSMLLEEGQKLFTACRKKQDAVSLFLHNFLQLFLQILKDLQDNKKEAVHREWKLPEERKLRNRLRMDSFEFRFASRLSLVLLCGFLFARLSKLDHSYWLVLNAFLLLQPMYEESAYRLKTRFSEQSSAVRLFIWYFRIFPALQDTFYLPALSYR